MLFPYITLSHPLCFFKQNFLSLCLFTLALSHTLFLSLYRRAISCAVASSSNGLPFKMHVYWQCLLSLPLNSTSLSLYLTPSPSHSSLPYLCFCTLHFCEHTYTNRVHLCMLHATFHLFCRCIFLLVRVVFSSPALTLSTNLRHSTLISLVFSFLRFSSISLSLSQNLLFRYITD